MSVAPLEVREIPLGRLVRAEWNANRVPADTLAKVRRSVEQFGVVENLVVRPHPGSRGKFEVLSGNHRLDLYRDLGLDSAPCHVVKLDDGRARVLAQVLNRTRGEDDPDAYRALMSTVLAEVERDEVLGLLPETERSLRQLEEEQRRMLAGDRDVDAAPEPPKKPRSKPGEVYELGPHRVMCGDARNAEHVRSLFDGRTAALAVTSPPYASQRAYDKASGFTPIRPGEYVEWYAAAAANIASVLADDGSYFCNIKEHCEDGQRHLYVTDLLAAHVRQWGWRWVDTFCWRDTKNGVPGGWPNRFKDAWEPVYHYSRHERIAMDPLANATPSDYVFDYSRETSKAGTGSGLLGSQKGSPERSGLARPSNVIEVAASSEGGHEAVFPVDLPAWFIRAFSKTDDVVFDPFLGSGSTLIAAQREGRICFGIEISAAYCDVIRQRYADHTGQPDLAP